MSKKSHIAKNRKVRVSMVSKFLCFLFQSKANDAEHASIVFDVVAQPFEVLFMFGCLFRELTFCLERKRL